MHVHKRLGPSTPHPVLAIDEHHVEYHSNIVLPLVTKLIPPLALNNLALVDLVDGPQMLLRLVQESGLKDVLFIWNWGFICVMINAELMLVIHAVE